MKKEAGVLAVAFVVFVALVVVAVRANEASARTPKATVKAYLAAMARGDEAQAVALTTAKSETTNASVRALAVTVHAAAVVDDAVRERFGLAKPPGVLDGAGKALANAALVDNATVEVDGDRAIFKPQGDDPVRLSRVDGTWKVEVAEAPADAEPSDTKRLGEAFRSAGDIVVKRVQAGDYSSGQAAWEDFDATVRRNLRATASKGTPGPWPERKKAEFYGFCQGVVHTSQHVPECDCMVEKMQERFKWVAAKNDFDHMDETEMLAVLEACHVSEAAQRARAVR